jgi:hypothetical protein
MVKRMRSITATQAGETRDIRRYVNSGMKEKRRASAGLQACCVSSGRRRPNRTPEAALNARRNDVSNGHSHCSSEHSHSRRVMSRFLTSISATPPIASAGAATDLILVIDSNRTLGATKNSV